MWLAVGLNVIGVQTGRWLQNVGGSAVFIPAGLVIVLGLYAVATRAPATAITPQSILPSLDDLNRLNFWASIPFAYAGLELAATLAGEVKNPERSLPRSVFLTAPIVATVYVLGTAALLWMVPPERLNVVTAILQGIASGVSDLPALRWVVPVAAAAITINVIGAVGAWLTGSARVAFAVGLDRYAPRGFARIHPRWGTPYVAILVQATLSTILLLVSVLGKGTRVETLYLVLLDTMLLVYFIPYIYLFLCYLRESSGSALVWLTAISGIFVTVFAMVVACIPPPESHYHLVKVVGGVLGFLVLGGVLYWRADRRSGMEIREAA
jgi:amino acid transporter